MARQTPSFNACRLLNLLFAITFVLPLTMARPHPIVQKRDIFSDIGNFFDNLEMQVDMTIFQPIENFFTEVATDINNYVIQPAENFFMQANTVIVSGLYDLTMLVDDIGNAIEQDVIDEVMSVENLAIQIGQEVTADVNTVVGDITNEFNNVITPALNQVGQEIGQGLNVAGADILQGLEAAGQYIEDHPELIAQIFLTVALTAVSVVQPEFVGVDGALIGDLVTEAAADAAGDVLGGLASDAVEGIGSSILEDGAEEVVDEADMTLFESISQSLDKYTGYFDNVNKILNLANDVNSTLTDVADIFPVTAQTIGDIQNIVNPIANATSGVAMVYGNIDQVLGYLNEAVKIVAVVARDAPALNEIDAPVLEARKKNKATTSSTTPSTTLATSTKAKTLSISTSSSSSSSASKGTVTSSSAVSSPTPTASDVPLPVLTQWVQHHWMNQTIGAKTYVKQQLGKSLHTQLSSGNMTAQNLKTMPQLNTVLTQMNSSLSYPPTPTAHRMAISHQIATGGATAYNAKNVTVKIQMNANAPVDVCLGVPKSSCFGNQLGNPYCLHDCASRWYNQMNVTPLHY